MIKALLQMTISPDCNGFTLQLAAWATHGDELYAVRHAVFVAEQGVPEELEQDEHDALCLHMLARDVAGRAIGTGRLLADGHIGRVAVLPAWRGRGVGAALMERLIALARQRGFRQVRLNAQTSALAFYEKLGFSAEGEDFIDAGIPHRRMTLILDDRKSP